MFKQTSGAATQAATIAEALAAGHCDFGFLHIKAVDDTGHDRAAALKVMDHGCSMYLWSKTLQGRLPARQRGEKHQPPPCCCCAQGSLPPTKLNCTSSCSRLLMQHITILIYLTSSRVYVHNTSYDSTTITTSSRHWRRTQVKYLEVADAMVGQLLRRLADADAATSGDSPAAAQQHSQPGSEPPVASGAAAGAGSAADGTESPAAAAAASAAAAAAARFAVCVTGDHSTPVVFGDHSHEAVPFALANVADAVSRRAFCRSALVAGLAAKMPVKLCSHVHPRHLRSDRSRLATGMILGRLRDS